MNKEQRWSRDAFRREAKGTTFRGGRYDANTMPEFRIIWQQTYERQVATINQLNADKQRLAKSEKELRILLQVAIGQRDAARQAKVRAETKLEQARKSERAAIGYAKSIARSADLVQKTQKSQNGKLTGTCPVPVIMIEH